MKSKTTNGIKEVGKVLGKEFSHEFGGLMLRVKIVDVKFAFGHVRWLIEPTDQRTPNQVWINAVENVKWLDPA